MPHNKNIILNSLKKSFSLIWKNKPLFALLFILQIIFFIVFSFVNITYQTKILENAKAITDYISHLKLDDVSLTNDILLQKNLLGEDPLAISRNFNEIVKNFRIYLVYVFLLLIFFTSINWSVSNKLINNNNFKKSIKNFSKNFVVLFFYIGLILWFFYSLFNISLIEAAQTMDIFAKFVPFLIFSIILLYFMFVSLSLLNNTELKDIVQKTLSMGIKKAHYILAVYFVNIILFLILTFLLYYFVEKNVLVLILSLLLMIFSFVFGRIFMINVVKKLET